MNKIHGDYLETEIEKQDVITINPPWKKLGIKFIDKAVNDLNDGGKLVCVMDYNKFTRAKAPGTFYDLQQRGYFTFIRNDSSRNKQGPFPGIGDSVAFVFVKGKKPKNHKTVIKNRIGEEFEYELKGIEIYVPQIPNEDEIFDWKNGIKIGSSGASQDFKEPTFIFANRLTYEKMKKGIFNKKEEKNFSGGKVPLSKINLEKFEEFLKKWNTVFWFNYTVSHGWMRLPPFRKDLDFWRNK